MPNHYLDTVVGASSTYDPVTRSATGGSDTSYSTLSSAATYLNGGTGRSLIVRSGEQTITANQALNKANTTISIYPDEVFVLTMSSSSRVFEIQSTATDLTMNLSSGVGYFKVYAPTQTFSQGVFHQLTTTGTTTINGGWFQFQGCLLACNSVAVTTFNSSRFTKVAAGAALDAGDLYINTNGRFIGNTVNFNSCIHDGPFLGASYTSTINIRNPSILPTTHNFVATTNYDGILVGSGCVVNLYNPLIVCGSLNPTTAIKYPIKVSLGGTLNLYGGHIVGCPLGPFDSATYSSNGGTLNVVVAPSFDTAVPKFESFGSQRFLVSLVVSGLEATYYYNDGSGHTAGTYQDWLNTSPLTTYRTVLDSYGVKGAYACDDMWINSQNAVARAAINSWLSSGHELLVSPSAGDAMDTTTPFQVRYIGAHANGGSLVISENSWKYYENGVLIQEYDTTPTEPWSGYPFTGNPADSTTPTDGAKGPVDRMDVGGSDYTGLFQWHSLGAAFDDPYADSFEYGTYTLPLGGSYVNVPFNETRRYELEIGLTKTTMEQLYGVGEKIGNVSYINVTSSVPGSLTTWLADNGYTSAIHYLVSDPRLKQTTNTSASNLNKTYTETTSRTTLRGEAVAYSNMNASDKQATIRSRVRRMCASGFSVGGYYIVEFPYAYATTGVTFSGDEVEWIVDELILCGAEILCPTEAVALLGKINISTNTSDVTQSSDSQSLGLGYKWWGNNGNPIGSNGEPFSDLDTDPGSAQSSHSAFHPLNLN